MDPAPVPRAPAQRADAQRNVTRILDAAAMCLSRDPDAGVGDIAKEAGLGRVTVYGHFPSRTDLVDAVVSRAIAEGDAVLRSIDLGGDARDALTRLIDASWLLIAQIGSLTAAAERALPEERLLGLHADPAARVHALVERGRTEGVFRTDLATSWLVTTLHRLVHGAAAEVAAGRLAVADAPRTIAATTLAAYAPPGSLVPVVSHSPSGEQPG